MQDPSRYACARIRWNLVPTFTPFPINLVHCSCRAKLWILGTVSRIIPPATSSPPRAQSRKLLKPRLEIQRTDGRLKIGKEMRPIPSTTSWLSLKRGNVFRKCAESKRYVTEQQSKKDRKDRMHCVRKR